MKSAGLFLLLVGLLALGALVPSASAGGKPGKCPKPHGAGSCEVRCSSDYDCKGNLKCCSNGCGWVCTPPVF